MRRCRKIFVPLQRVYKVGKLWQNAYWISSFSRKSPVFDQTEGGMPTLFACMCNCCTPTGIRHFPDFPFLLRSLAIPLLKRTPSMAYALFYFSFEINFMLLNF